MGTGEHRMSDTFGITVLRNAYKGVKELESTISNHRSGPTPTQLEPLITSLGTTIADYTGEEERKQQQQRGLFMALA